MVLLDVQNGPPPSGCLKQPPGCNLRRTEVGASCAMGDDAICLQSTERLITGYYDPVQDA